MARKVIIFLFVAALNGAATEYYANRVFGADTIGLLDFQIHHTAFIAAMNGENPYNTDLLKSYLDPHKGYIPRGEFGFFYPPWALVVLSPILLMPVRIAAWTWLGINLILLSVVAYATLWWQKIRTDRRMYVAFGAILLFPPAIDALRFGQINILGAFALALAIWSFANNKNWLAGIFLPIMLLKPNIFFLPLVVLGVYAWHHRRYSFFISATVWLVAALILSGLLSPRLPLEWMQSVKESGQYLGGVLEVNTSLPAQIVRIVHAVYGVRPDFLKILVPLASVVVLGALAIRNRQSIRLEYWLPPAIILSPFLSGYSWFHDCILLLIPYAIILGRAAADDVPKATRTKIFLRAAILNLVVLELMILTNPEKNLFWYPIAMLCFYYSAMKTMGAFKARVQK